MEADKLSRPKNDDKTKREKLIELIRRVAIKKPEKVISVPEGLHGFGTLTAVQCICIGCHKCEEVCKVDAPLIENKFDLPSFFEDIITKDVKSENRRLLLDFIKKIAVKKPV